jgi:hypothetical protein
VRDDVTPSQTKPIKQVLANAEVLLQRVDRPARDEAPGPHFATLAASAQARADEAEKAFAAAEMNYQAAESGLRDASRQSADCEKEIAALDEQIRRTPPDDSHPTFARLAQDRIIAQARLEALRVQEQAARGPLAEASTSKTGAFTALRRAQLRAHQLRAHVIDIELGARALEYAKGIKKLREQLFNHLRSASVLNRALHAEGYPATAPLEFSSMGTAWGQLPENESPFTSGERALRLLGW